MKKLIRPEKMDQADIKERNREIYKKFFGRLFKEKKKVAGILLLMFLDSVIYLCVPFLLKAGVQKLYLLQSFHYILIWAIVLIVAGLVIGLLRENAVVKFSYNFVNEIKKDLYRGILKKPLHKFKNVGVGKSLAFISYNLGLVKSLVSDWGTVAIQQMLNFLALFIASFFVDIRLSLLFLMMVPIFVIYMVVIQYIVKKYAMELMTLNKYIYQNAIETLTDFENVKIMNLEPSKFNSFAKLVDQDMKIRVARTLIYQYNKIVLHAISLLLIIAFIAIGGGYLNQQEMTFSEFIFFVLYIHLLFRPFEMMLGASAYFEAGKIGIKTVFPYVSASAFGKLDRIKLKGNLRIEDVSYKNTRSKFKLSKINLNVAAGEHVAILADNISGKGLFVQMLLQLKKLQKGKVYFDEKVLTPQEARQAVAVVSNDYSLSPGTIYTFLKGNKRGEGFDDRLVYLCHELGLNDKIVMMDSKRFQSKINQGDLRFSETEKMKMSLVRAVYKDTAIIVLDNFWHGLDTMNREIVARFLENYCEEKTVIQLSSKEDLLLPADRVMRLVGGKLV